MKIAGTWKKVTAESCAENYPDEIEFFRDRARFLAKKGPSQRFIWWDAGSYEIVADDQVRMSTASDELVIYKTRLEGDVLTFTDQHGCTYSYQRIS